ncbi:MAG: hypothetical protein Q8P12_02140 [bacterium]|nr:hypothetical protein [bacterium]
MIRKPLRRILRVVLAALSRAVIRKHDPTIIAVMGEGKTGIAREAVYTVLKKKFPTRRNLESPYAEFVLPLTILGAREYPTNYRSWLKTLAKAAAQVVLLPRHKNFLVLEIGYIRKETFDYFWKITQPEVLITCGETPYLSKNQTAPHTIKVKESSGLDGYLQAAAQVGKLFGIPAREARQSLKSFSLPQARIRIIPSRSGGVIIDATYQYFPPEKKALEEILRALPGQHLVLSPKDWRSRLEEAPKKRVVVLTGPYKAMWPALTTLTRAPWT